MFGCIQCGKPFDDHDEIARHEFVCPAHVEVRAVRRERGLYPCNLKHKPTLDGMKDLDFSPLATLYYLYVPRYVALVFAVVNKPEFQHSAIRMLRGNAEVRDAVIALSQIVGDDNSVKQLLMIHVNRFRRSSRE